MADDYGVDLNEVFNVIGTAEVLIVRFQLIQPRLLVDFRTKAEVGPYVALVPKAESVEDRFRSIRKLRPQLPFPDKVLSFHWPRSAPVLLASQVWQRLVDRMGALGGTEAIDACATVYESLLREERDEVGRAIRGAETYQTLWQRARA